MMPVSVLIIYFCNHELVIYLRHGIATDTLPEYIFRVSSIVNLYLYL